MCGEQPAHDGVDPRAIDDAGGVVGVERVGFQLRHAQRVDEAAEEGIVGRCQRDLAVARRKQPIGCGDRMVVAAARRHGAGGEIGRRDIGQQADHAVGQADLGPLALAGAPGVHNRRRDAQRGIETGHQIADRQSRPQRWVLGAAVDAHEAGQRLGDEIEGRAIAIRAGAAEAVDRAHDQRRPQRLQAVVVEAHARQHAGAEILYQHIRPLDQARQCLLRLRRAQVEDDRAFVAVELGKVIGQAILFGALVADGVTFRRLHLDDLRTHVAQQSGAERAGEDACEIEDLDPGERPSQRHLRFLSVVAAPFKRQTVGDGTWSRMTGGGIAGGLSHAIKQTPGAGWLSEVMWAREGCGDLIRSRTVCLDFAVTVQPETIKRWSYPLSRKRQPSGDRRPRR